MKLTLVRHSHIVYRTRNILELGLDPLSYSDIDYWSQSDRALKVKLLLDRDLEDFLLGSLRELKAGFHTFAAYLQDNDGKIIYRGTLPQGNLNISYLSHLAKTVELNFTDHLGLLLTLAKDRTYTLSGQFINPVEAIPPIIEEILFPTTPEPDTESYSNADVRYLCNALGPFNYRLAHAYYDQDKWTPFRLVDHVLLSIQELEFGNYPSFHNTIIYGFQTEGQDAFFIYWQYVNMPARPFLQHFRYRKYLLCTNGITLIEQTDLHNDDPDINLERPPAPNLTTSLIVGESEYRVKNKTLYYTGLVALDTVEFVPGDYKADALLGELLRVANAVLTVDLYDFKIINRQDDALPVANFADPLEFEINQSDSSAPQLTPVAIASQAILDAIAEHYKAVLDASPFEATLKTHLCAPDFQALSLSHPHELLAYAIVFDNYRIRPLELSYDPVTQEIEISGRASHA
ncbi:MAG TPA: hypothetical protein PK433_03610 [Candidatus Cloacimonadota bacterium]|nr:hypothetical protein [Candidatus Cloacimonadota bacterium]HOR58626.1 hypothetical protein [Candidatus Cloacimonadota bacterium]